MVRVGNALNCWVGKHVGLTPSELMIINDKERMEVESEYAFDRTKQP